MLSAGLEGIKNQMALPDPVEQNILEWSASLKKKAGIETLPQSLGEAISVAEESKFLKETLGEHIYHSLIENKKIEWKKYCTEISRFELEEYLPVL